MAMKKIFIILSILLITVAASSALLYTDYQEGTEESIATPATKAQTNAVSKAPSPPSGIKGSIESISMDKDKYYAGDTVVSEMHVKNTGIENITSEKVVITVKCIELESFAGNMALKGMSEDEKTQTYTIKFLKVLNPGESKKLSATFNTPEEMSGVSLAGEYELTLQLKFNDRTVDSEKMNLLLHKK
ncbi:MAG: hypothetical protein SVJ22_00325 [Halobacteriota archaeon]|nr:hypothetical protein [Halobacteriota archaeon]